MCDANGMLSCYASDVIFCDPVFGILKGDDPKNMWHMLIERSKGNLKITFNCVEANETKGSANWVAEYFYGNTGRKIINKVSAKFEFKDGKIISHRDYFNLWRWTSQALGWKGYLFGWTPFIRKRIQKSTADLLKNYNKSRIVQMNKP